MLKTPFQFFRVACFRGHSLIVEKTCFTVKNNGRLSFSSRKKARETGIERKTNFNMASETITTGLKNYAIGSKIRRLRLRKSMGLVELGKHTGLSPALLSKLERDLMHPTLATLLRIAMVFSVGLEYFFNAEPKPVLEIVRKKDRLRFPDSPDVDRVAYHFESLDFPAPNRELNSYLADFEPAGPERSRLHQHPGIEFLYVLSGKLELRTVEDEHELAEGDAIYFDSTVLHGYCRMGLKPTTALVVTLGSRE
jgi:transcriptional regulator with XRE-family HTH domain